MMHTPLEDFLIAARIDAAYAAKALEWEEARRVDERVEKRLEQEDKGKREVLDVVTAIIVAGVSPAKRRELSERLGYHQVAVILALQDNRERLDAVEEHRDDLFENAHILEDGRRVFETKDGTRVYDEFGHQVGADEIKPEQIDDARPKWETYEEALAQHERLIEEQTVLLDYQTRLDDAQTRMRNGNLTQDDVSDLEELLSEAPTAVRAHLPSTDPEALSVSATVASDALYGSQPEASPDPINHAMFR